MSLSAFRIAAVVLAAACASGSAQAQYYASAPNMQPPLYPYVQQQNRNAGQPYAVEVAPGQYVIHRPEDVRSMRRTQHPVAPVVQPVARPIAKPVAKAEAKKRLKTKTDPALVEELRQRVAGKPIAKPVAKPAQSSNVINTTKYVRHKPTVNERIRYVDLPPRVVERYTVVDDNTGDKRVVVEAPQDVVPAGKPVKGEKTQRRVIQADAEITVLGPDRMTIQLYRKGERGKGARIN